jgi:hypothetical protein
MLIVPEAPPPVAAPPDIDDVPVRSAPAAFEPLLPDAAPAEIVADPVSTAPGAVASPAGDGKPNAARAKGYRPNTATP